MSSRFTYTLDEMLELQCGMQLRSSRRPHWFWKNSGICGNLIEIRTNTVVRVKNLTHFRPLNHYFKTWEHFSGDLEFPVPGLTEGANAEDKYFSVANLYDRRDPYCKLRYDLVDHIIKQMRAEIK